MKYAIQLVKSGANTVVNAAVIVDPSVKQVIATACDQTCSWYAPANKTTLETYVFKKPEAFVSHSESDGVLSYETLHSNSLPNYSKHYILVFVVYILGDGLSNNQTLIPALGTLYDMLLLLLLNLLLPGTFIFSPVWEKSKISVVKWTTHSLLLPALQPKDKRPILQMLTMRFIWILMR